MSRCSYVSYVSQLACVERGAQNHPIQPDRSARYLQQKKCQHFCLQGVEVVRAAVYYKAAHAMHSNLAAYLVLHYCQARKHAFPQQEDCLLPPSSEEVHLGGAACLGTHRLVPANHPTDLAPVPRHCLCRRTNVLLARQDKPKSVSRGTLPIATRGQRKACHSSHMHQP